MTFSKTTSSEDVILQEERTTEQERRAIHEGITVSKRSMNDSNFLFCFTNENEIARKYAELKRIRQNRSGKQQSVDDDEEDIGKKTTF